MHGHIDDPDLHLDLLDSVDDFAKAVCNLHAAQWNSRQNDGGQFPIPFDDLVCNPTQSATNGLRIHHWSGRV